ncbi:unnamed protein product [Cylindrotheca closterium]|uniref:SET domain-containing protein n=1 Tax=Cylindrotheca closterium TaxID=2856 RepID=A0AAD2FP28_9STRA|nr:unnamed protein product [Cylindrotheca closterium]
MHLTITPHGPAVPSRLPEAALLLQHHPRCHRFPSSVCLHSKIDRSTDDDDSQKLIAPNDDNVRSPNPLRLQVKEERRLRTTGLIIGISFLSLASVLGILLGLFDPLVFLGLLLIGISIRYGITESYNEYQAPFPSSAFEVQPSTIPSAGMGLFAGSNLAKSTYLFDYEGEVLTEEDYFSRYPNGDGRYVARVDTGFFSLLGSEPVYIDGIDPKKSNKARYMNSASEDMANVYWKKQQFGFQAGVMHFYSSRDIQKGEELFFDYGDTYWQAADQIDSSKQEENEI